MSVVEQVSENRLFHYYYLLSCGHVIWMRPAWCVLMQPDTSGYLRECVRKSPYIFCLFLSKLLIRFRFVSNTLGTWESIKLLFSNIPEDIVHLKTFPIRMQNEQQTWHEEKKKQTTLREKHKGITWVMIHFHQRAHAMVTMCTCAVMIVHSIYCELHNHGACVAKIMWKRDEWTHANNKRKVKQLRCSYKKRLLTGELDFPHIAN